MLWYVMFGGALGSGARYLLSPWIQHRAGAVFPIGTLVINVTGSFLVALIFRYTMESAAIRPEVRALLTTGFCGGYTTFAAFSYETVKLVEDGDWHRAAWYIVLSLAFSVAGAFLGIAAAQQLLELRRHV